VNRPVVVLALLAAALAACGPAAHAGAAAHASRPAPSPAGTAAPPAAAIAALPSPPAPGQPVAAQLTIRGATQADVSVTRSQGVCGKGVAGYSAQLTFPLRGRSYVLSMQVGDYHGPGQYTMPPERVSMHTQTGDPNPLLVAATSGMVAISADERSGSIDATFSDGSRVTGAWACSP
jgi:hypothetical protein